MKVTASALISPLDLPRKFENSCFSGNCVELNDRPEKVKPFIRACSKDTSLTVTYFKDAESKSGAVQRTSKLQQFFSSSNTLGEMSNFSENSECPCLIRALNI